MSPTPPTPPMPRRSPSRPPPGRDLDEEPHTGSHTITRGYARHVGLITILWSVGGALATVVVGTIALYKWGVGEVRAVAQQEREAAELRETRREHPYVFPPIVPKDGGNP